MAGKNEDLKFSIALDDAAFRQQLTNEKGQLTRFGREAKRLFKQVGDDRALQLGKELKLLNDIEVKQKKYLSTLRQTIGAGGRGGAGGFGGRGQQALTAAVYGFEDFNAVTGSLSQKLRGVSNNLSQLGMALGGVQGLIAGVAISTLGSFAAKIWEANDAMADSKSVADAMNQAEKDLAAARADAAAGIKKISDELRGVGLNKGGKAKQAAADEAEAIGEAATKALRDAVAAVDPQVRDARLKAEGFRKQAADSNVLPFRSLMERKAAEQDAIAQARIDEVVAAGPVDPKSVAMRAALQMDELLGEMQKDFRDKAKAAAETGGFPVAPPKALVEAESAMRDLLDDFKKNPNPERFIEAVPRMFNDVVAKSLGANASPAKGSFEERMLRISSEATTSTELRDAFNENAKGQAVASLSPIFREVQAEIERFQEVTSKGLSPLDADEAARKAAEQGRMLSQVFEGVRVGGDTAENAGRTLAEQLDLIRQAIPEWEAYIEQEKALGDARKKAADEAVKLQEAEKKRLDGLAEAFKAKSPLFQEDRDREKVRGLLEGAREAGVANPLAAVIGVLSAEFAGAASGVKNFSVAAKKSTMVLQDTSTGAGAAEYARLLSGDDSSRSAELSEARGTNKRLDTLIGLAQDEAAI